MRKLGPQPAHDCCFTNLQGRDRPAVSVLWTLGGPDLQVEDTWFGRTIIRCEDVKSGMGLHTELYMPCFTGVCHAHWGVGHHKRLCILTSDRTCRHVQDCVSCLTAHTLLCTQGLIAISRHSSSAGKMFNAFRIFLYL